MDQWLTSFVRLQLNFGRMLAMVFAPSLFERFGQGTFSSLGFRRFGDPTLRAEQSISFDFGFDQRVAKDRARFGATYFYTHLKRVIGFNNFFVVDPLGLGRFSG